MARRKILTDEQIAKLPTRASAYPDPELAGHYIRVRPTGKRVFCVVARDPRGKQVWHTIGGTDLYNVAEAREAAREVIKAIKTGGNRDGAETFESVAGQWIKRYVEAKGLISAPDIKSYLSRVLIPAWGGREFCTIKRSDVAKLLDEVEDKSGVIAADYVLSIIRGICNWYATRHDDYSSPVVKGMRRSNPKERARARILEDDELRVLWAAAEKNGHFGAFVRVALLTGQRREKIVSMSWQDIVDGEWRIPASDREKSTAGSLVLPQAALDIIQAQPRFAANAYVFAGVGANHIGGMSKRKAAFDKQAGVSGWTIHDLRRTARSLMSRAGVRPDIAERVLGHAIRGVEGTYDRHSYREEKAHALNALAELIGNIINPPAGN
ncbi:tyrosine-type recombinase/integrase, partial [Methyloceanibacter sp.]|uniref:tyrosine-type recombinase/integrase n=1 Tax=Methyloceanibacter sp. TaxID=1965321 RepID=UPI00351B90C0